MRESVTLCVFVVVSYAAGFFQGVLYKIVRDALKGEHQVSEPETPVFETTCKWCGGKVIAYKDHLRHYGGFLTCPWQAERIAQPTSYPTPELQELTNTFRHESKVIEDDETANKHDDGYAHGLRDAADRIDAVLTAQKESK